VYAPENAFYPEFIERDASVSASSSLRRGDAVAQLTASDADLGATCHGLDSDHCPCARLSYALEAGDTAGLFAVDGSTGLVTVAAADLAPYDGRTATPRIN